MYRTFAFILGLFGVSTILLPAQTLADLEQQASASRKPSISLSGNVGASAELFSSTRASTRDPFIGRGFTNLSLGLGGFRTGLNLLYSTENQNFRQSINRLGLEGGWSWLQLGAGDTYPQFSEFGLNGVMLRGGYGLFQPSGLRLGFAAGTTQTAINAQAQPDITVDGFSSDGQFRRDLYAGTIGFQDRVFKLYFTGVSAKDDTLSIQKSGNARPMSNLSLGGVLGLDLKHFLADVEATASAINHDLRATALDQEEVLNSVELSLTDGLDPVLDWLWDRFSPTAGAAASYAIRARSAIRTRPFTVLGQYRYVAPGFQSLGLYTIRDDVQNWSVQPTLNLAGGHLTLNGQYAAERNNLSEQRASTLERTIMSGNLRFQAGGFFSFSGQFQQTQTTSLPADQNMADVQHQTIQNISLNPTISFSTQKTHRHQLQLTAARQRFANEEAGNRTQFDNRNASAFWNSQLPRQISLQMQVGYLDNTSALGTNQTWMAQGGGQKMLNGRKTRLDFQVGFNQTEQSFSNTPAEVFRQWNSRLALNQRWGSKTQVYVQVQGTLNESTQLRYREIRSRIQMTRQF